jgi:uncharacterized protein YmfQ (DUF2313 family)
LKQCSWCNKGFSPTVSYQIYCSTDCRDSATKEKIAERQQFLKRKKRNQKTRHCAGGCGTQLSIYNDGELCDKCHVNVKQLKQKIKELKGFLKDDEA